MNIVIYGTGGVGGYFGARLAEAGNNVTFIARGKHLQAIQKNGLQLLSPKGDYLVKPANATDDISEIKDIDVIFVCTKTWQVAEVAEKIKPVLNKNTMVISLLNGVENQDVLCSVIDKKHVLGGLCLVVSKVEDYGIINHMSYEPTIVFGELNLEISERALQLEKILNEAGITNRLSNSIFKEIWTKFLYITTVSAIGALTRSTNGEMIASPEIYQLMKGTSKEIVAVAQAKGIDINEETIEKTFKIIDNQPYSTTASLQRDIMEGKPSELEAQNGTVVKFGKQLGVPTPINDFIYYCLLPQEKRARL
ncbi:ketopantoate reductase family protein [Lutibacter sp.]|uniref:ketopantoate reductase family protein n=1 Tax=Lutibacter sp. TaxID=1925666 RepID=UPI003565478C